MEEDEDFDGVTETIRQSIITAKGKKHSIREFDGEVFELTKEMLVGEIPENPIPQTELSGIAEGIIQKYAKLLSVR